MNGFRSSALVLFWGLGQIFPAWAAGPLRLAVVPLEKQPGLSDQVLVELSKMEGVEVVERDELQELLGEAGLKALAGESKETGSVQHLLGVDVLVRLRVEEGQLWVGVVDAQSGVVLASERIAVAAPKKEKLAALLKRIDLKKSGGSPGLRVAVEVRAEKEKGLEVQVSQGIETFLKSSDCTVVDRLVVGHVAAEHVLVESGMAGADGEKIRPMLGADLILLADISPDRPSEIKFSLLDLARGSIKAQSRFVLKGKTPEPAAYDWLSRQLKIRPDIPAEGHPTSQIEAIKPLYQGIRLYYEGDYLSAIEAFAAALVLDDKFDEALLWEARCYDALGLGLLGEATRRYRDDVMFGAGLSSTLKSPVVEGVTFLGVQGSNPLLCRGLELEAAGVLGGVVQGKLQLTEQLEVFRNEYDVLTGAKAKQGVLWTAAPGFFTRWSVNGTLLPDQTVRWTLLDSLEGKVRSTLVTPARPGAMREHSGDFAQFLRPARDSQEIAVKQLKAEDFSVAQLRKDVDSPLDKVANRAFLILAILDPADPFLRGRYLHRGGNNRNGLEGFLNFASREYLIGRLPVNDSWRLWLELKQISTFLPYEPRGLLFLGKPRDPLADLQKFIKSHPGKMQTVFAEYMLLWEKMSGMPPGEIEQNCGRILEDYDAVQDEALLEHKEELRGMIDHLRTLARYAGGKVSSGQPLPAEVYPYRLQPEPSPWGKIFPKRTSLWRCNEWDLIEVPPEIRRQEAQAALFVLGRPDNQYLFDPAWIDACPDSIVLLTYMIETLHEVDHPLGRPFRNPFDMEAERSAYLKRVDWGHKSLLAWMKRAQSPKSLGFATDQARRFVMHLTRYAFADSLSDAKFVQIQGDLAEGIEAAAKRVGCDAPDLADDYWRRMPRRLSTDDFYVWHSLPKRLYDPRKQLETEQSLGKRAWSSSPIQDPAWWNFVHSEQFDSFFHRRKVGDIVAGYEGDMQRIFAKGDLGVKEAGFVLDYAVTLFFARRYAQAEPWFRKLAETPESDLNRFEAAQEIILNGKLYLALALCRMGRENEAMEWLKQCQGLDMKKAPRVIRRVNPGGRMDYSGGEEGANLETNALRIMGDLRIQQGRDSLPKNIVALNIPLKDGNGAALPCFARIPAGYRADSDKKYRILIVVGSQDLRGLNACLDDSEWARYADEQDLFLLSPDFLLLFEAAEYWYHFPQDWSGEVVLSAIESLKKDYRVDPDHLFLHGYGGGGQFVERFARFVPARCSAVSAHSTNGAAWMDGSPGLRPLAELKHVDFFVSCGEFDDRRIETFERNSLAVQFVTGLQGAGVTVIWKSWPGMGHRPGPQVGEMAREFFTAELEKKPGGPSWIGDIRTGKYLKADDPRLAGIPGKFRVSLASEKLARIFGEPFPSE